VWGLPLLKERVRFPLSLLGDGVTNKQIKRHGCLSAKESPTVEDWAGGTRGGLKPRKSLRTAF
tara:strand:- start:255 stop:443 length:189 start_codon:yes stop_codon:yes gene_type:complete